jgi:integrase
MGRRPKQRERVYWRDGRAYGDFRDYHDVEGKRERLIVKGEKLATQDPVVAGLLASARLRDLEDARRNRGVTGRVGVPLATYAASHLAKKDKSRKVTRAWVDQSCLFLQRAVEFFGEGRDIGSITVEDVQAYTEHLTTATNAHGRPFSPGTQRHVLNALSNLYRRAQSESKVGVGYNPVASMMDKPSGVKREARWLEVHQAALLLEAARTLPSDPGHADGLPAATAHALVATFLLTGGRSAEVLGLEVADVSFDRSTVTFRVHEERPRFKTPRSARVVPLHPQLREILAPYIFGRPPSRLLFPSYITGKEAMLKEWRGTLDRVAARAGWQKGEIRSKMFRHTFCAARLQTLDNGAPVSAYTVSREMGHGSQKMVEDVYSHLGAVRHRSDVLEYRIEPFAEVLKEQLDRMGIYLG